MLNSTTYSRGSVRDPWTNEVAVPRKRVTGLLASRAVVEQAPGGQPTGSPQDSGAGMGPRASEVEAANRHRVAAPSRHRSHEEDLVERDLPVGPPVPCQRLPP